MQRWQDTVKSTLRLGSDGLPRVALLNDDLVLKRPETHEDLWRELAPYINDTGQCEPCPGFVELYGLYTNDGIVTTNLIVCGPSTPLASEWDIGNGKSLSTPYSLGAGPPGLVFKYLGKDVEATLTFLPQLKRLRIAGAIIDAIAILAHDGHAVTDFRLNNIVNTDQLTFIDGGSLCPLEPLVAISSFVVLGLYFRNQIESTGALMPLYTALSHALPASATEPTVMLDLGLVVKLSVQLALARLFDFKDTCLVFFPPLDVACAPLATRIRPVHLADRPETIAEFRQTYSVVETLVDYCKD